MFKYKEHNKMAENKEKTRVDYDEGVIYKKKVKIDNSTIEIVIKQVNDFASQITFYHNGKIGKIPNGFQLYDTEHEEEINSIENLAYYFSFQDSCILSCRDFKLKIERPKQQLIS